MLIPLTEFLERYAVGEALSANTNTLKNTIASQLVKNKWCIYLASTFLVVGYDTSNKVRVGISKGHHKFG
jgi:hypothetical protein